MKRTIWLLVVAVAVITVGMGHGASQGGSVVEGADVIHQAEQSMALVLVGDGAGHVQSVTCGVIISADGRILTPYHPLKNAQEVQVRLRDGEVYDQVELAGFDERRDMAVLHIPASGLAQAGTAALEENLTGEKIHVLTVDDRLAWWAGGGVLGPARLADELTGAGHGYRLVEFMAPVPQGTLGGALVDSRGLLIGIIPAFLNSRGQQFAIPVQSVAGLPSQNLHRFLGSGKDLVPPAMASPTIPATGEALAPDVVLSTSRSLRVASHTLYFTPFMLERELLSNPDFRSLEIDVVKSDRGGELLVEVDRPIFTYDFTYTVSESHSGIVLATGKVIAIDGPHAAQGISKRLVEDLQKARAAHPSQPNQAEALSVQP